MTNNFYLIDTIAAQYRADRLNEAANERLWAKASKVVANTRDGAVAFMAKRYSAARA